MTRLKTDFRTRKALGLALLAAAAGLAAGAQGGPGKNSQQTFLEAVDSLKAKHWAQARSEFKKVLKDDPENLKAHFYLGEIEYYTHHFPEAEGYLRWVNFHDPNAPVSHYYLGRVCYDQKHYDQALLEMERANHLDHQISMVHYYIGLVHYKQNDVSGAQRELAQAVILDPSSSKIHYALAYLLYHNLRQKDHALAEADAAMKGDSDAAMRTKALKLKNEIKSGKNPES
jgi:Tfp pilus assembly protein PilF